MTREKPLFLLTNDDGIYAPGIIALGEELSKLGEVVTVAPTSERSAQSQAITINQPLRVVEIDKNRYAVDGTPADCVMFSVQQLFQERPDWVISGINHGGNLGTDIMYSGTVGAALEGCMSGIRSLAVSLEGVEREPYNYDVAAKITKMLLEREEVLSLNEGELLNVNVPNFPYEEIAGIRTAKVGRRIYEGKMWERQDPRGRRYYWIGGNGYGYSQIPESDCVLLNEGFVTVSVLQPSFFHASATAELGERLEAAFGNDLIL